MPKIIHNLNGIWTCVGSKPKVNYPSKGNSDSINVESNSFWFKHRNSVIYTVIKRFPFKHDFCDIGGGNGFQIEFLSKKIENKKFILVEPGYFGCINAKKRNIKNIYNMSFENFPINNFNIDGIGLFDVLEHIKDDYKFILRVAKKCPPGTKIYITTPADQFLWSQTDDYGSHYRRYTKQTMTDLAKLCKLKVIYQSYFFSFLTPLIFLFRVIPYRLGRRLNSEELITRENRQHRDNGLILKYLINKSSSWENYKISSGSLNLGSSLFTVIEVN